MIQVIDVFEEDFDFNATSLEVAENMPIGSSVGQMIQTAGSEGVVSYHLIHTSGQLLRHSCWKAREN